VSVTGRGSSSAGQLKAEPPSLGQPVAVASVSMEVGDRGNGPGGRAVRRRRAGEVAVWVMVSFCCNAFESVRLSLL
jgi:hypothetical protein